jgi:hypothetical protein
MEVMRRFYISSNHLDKLSQEWDFFVCEDDKAPERLDDDSEFGKPQLHFQN